MKLSHQWSSFALLILVQACGNPFDIQDSCDSGFYTTNTGKRMQWPDGQRIDFEMHSSVPAEMRDPIIASSQRYNEVFSSTTLQVIDSQLSTPAFNGNVNKVQGDNVNAIYWVGEDNWAWGESDPQAVAMTVVTFSRTGIKESDVFFRSKVFTRNNVSTLSSVSLPFRFLSEFSLGSFKSIASAAYNATAANVNITEHQTYMVSVHELGHAIGRCHSQDPVSIMYPEVSPGSEKDRANPLKGDIETLSQAYSI